MKPMPVQRGRQEGLELVKKWLKSIVFSLHLVTIKRLRPNYTKQTNTYQDEMIRFVMERYAAPFIFYHKKKQFGRGYGTFFKL